MFQGKFIGLHDVISHKIKLFIVTAMRTSTHSYSYRVFLKRHSSYICIQLPNYVANISVFGVSEFISLGGMCFPLWQRREAPSVIKMAYSIKQRVLLKIIISQVFYASLHSSVCGSEIKL
jgi:hypothetical protein